MAVSDRLVLHYLLQVLSEGAGRSGAVAHFESNYRDDLSKDEAIDMAIKALHKGTEGKLNPDATEIGIVDKDFKFHMLIKQSEEIRIG